MGRLLEAGVEAKNDRHLGGFRKQRERPRFTALFLQWMFLDFSNSKLPFDVSVKFYLGDEEMKDVAVLT